MERYYQLVSEAYAKIKFLHERYKISKNSVGILGYWLRDGVAFFKIDLDDIISELSKVASLVSDCELKKYLKEQSKIMEIEYGYSFYNWFFERAFIGSLSNWLLLISMV